MNNIQKKLFKSIYYVLSTSFTPYIAIFTFYMFAQVSVICVKFSSLPRTFNIHFLAKNCVTRV